MNINEIRKRRLFRSLEEPQQPRKSPVQRRFSTHHSVSSPNHKVRKLNKSKKHLMEEERNTQIERDNRILYEKIASHFRKMRETREGSAVGRERWHKKSKQSLPTEQIVQVRATGKSFFQESLSKLEQLPTPRRKAHSTTLFYGRHSIDGIAMKLMLTLSEDRLYLVGRNRELSVQLEMGRADYEHMQQTLLEGNPCNLFKHLVIEGGEVRLRLQENSHEKYWYNQEYR